MTAHLCPRERKVLGVCKVRGRKKIRRSELRRKNKCMKAVRDVHMSVCVQEGIEGKKCRRYNKYNEREERGKAESVSIA